MDDDDEFGDLYTDVLRPFTLTPDPSFTTSNKNLTPELESLDTNQSFLPQTTKFTPNSIGEDTLFEVKQEKPDQVDQIKELTITPARVSVDLRIGGNKGDTFTDNSNKAGFFTKEEAGVDDKLEIDLGIDDLGDEPQIPGISGNFNIPGGFDGVEAEEGKEEDWDSDSEDDLQIVLNENPGQIGAMEGNDGMGSDDDGEDLVIVADGADQPLQTMEDVDWGEDLQQGVDGERKEAGENVKVNGVGSAVGGQRIGYNNHLYPSHHSQFKYVRPGAAVVPGGTIVGRGGPPGLVRPLVNMGLGVGRGRGDWRPMGIKTAPGVQKPFHSGFGMPTWGNNSSGRGFGSGLEFTLPSHKSAFDIDIESFEDKPWRNPGVDLSDFFNFGLDEENWKDYCKQMEQLRLEATMQSRIRVYESGRSEQEYDPDLPPELAAAAGIQDASAGNAQLAKLDGAPSDLNAQGRGTLHTRPPLVPTGRAIQVESGYTERLPSIDTRPPRVRDSDAIIEIVLQRSGDDDPMTVDDNGNGSQRDDIKEGNDEEDISQTEYFDRASQPYNGRKKEMAGRREPFMDSDDNMHEGGGLSPLDHDGRWSQGNTQERHARQKSERGNDGIPCESVHVNKVQDTEKEKLGESISEEDPDAAAEVVRESSLEHKVDLQNELEMGDSIALEEEEADKDVMIPIDTIHDGSPAPSVKRQKLSSRVEQPTVHDINSVDGLRATRSSDNSKARSGSSRDFQKRHDGGEEEVVQEARSRRMEDVKRRRDEEEHNFRRKDDRVRDGRQDMERSRAFAKGREDSQVSYPYRDWDPNLTHIPRGRTGDIERSRERDTSVGARPRRDDDAHGRRLKDEDTRKREHVDEIGYRQRSKVREIEKSDKGEHLHARKRLDNGDWKGHHDRDVGPIRHENFDDSHTRRRKEEEHLRRELADKEALHGYRAKEDASRRKRERDDSLDQRKREEQPRLRDKLDDNHSLRHREESWRLRERDERRPKQLHEDISSNREREGRNSVRSGRDLEDKSWVGTTRVKDEYKGLGSDKDFAYKDKRRLSEHAKRSDRVEEDAFPQHRVRDNGYARENQFINEDRNPRHERSITNNDRPWNATDSQLLNKERHKDNMRSKESDRTDQNTLGSSKRRQEDHNTNRSEKVSSKVASEQESGNTSALGHTGPRDHGQPRLSSSTALSKKSSHEHDAPQQRHSSRKHREDAPLDDEQHNSRRGRSKLERWTSNKDRDDITNSISISSKAKESGRNNIDSSSEVSEQPDDQIGAVGFVENQLLVEEERSTQDLESKEADTESVVGNMQVESDKVEDDRHLDTVAKLKKRSERFKTPMPSDKDTTIYRKVESEVSVSTQSEIAIDTEVKPERPARKRRWVSS